MRELRTMKSGSTELRNEKRNKDHRRGECSQSQHSLTFVIASHITCEVFEDSLNIGKSSKNLLLEMDMKIVMEPLRNW